MIEVLQLIIGAYIAGVMATAVLFKQKRLRLYEKKRR